MTPLIRIQLGVNKQLGCFIYFSDSTKTKTAEKAVFHDQMILISHQFYLIVQQQFFIMIIRFSLHASIPNFNFSQFLTVFRSIIEIWLSILMSRIFLLHGFYLLLDLSGYFWPWIGGFSHHDKDFSAFSNCKFNKY